MVRRPCHKHKFAENSDAKKLLCIAIDSYCQNKGRKHKVKPKDK